MPDITLRSVRREDLVDVEFYLVVLKRGTDAFAIMRYDREEDPDSSDVWESFVDSDGVEYNVEEILDVWQLPKTMREKA